MKLETFDCAKDLLNKLDRMKNNMSALCHLKENCDKFDRGMTELMLNDGVYDG